MVEIAVDKHADDIAARAGAIDIAVNAVGVAHVQGTPFTELSYQDYAHRIAHDRVGDRAVRSREPHALGGIERLGLELEGLDAAVHDER
jgi:hypothetical protein